MVDFADPLEAVSTDYYPAPNAATSSPTNNNSRPGLPPLAPRSAHDDRAQPNDIGVTSSYEDEEEETDAEMDKESVKRWDEGGPSDCGYATAVHETLMSVGAKVHALVGAPSGKVRTLQDSVGNWFQELSYATRDIMRGENTDDMHKDAADAVSTLFYGQDENNATDEKKMDDEHEAANVGTGAVVLQRDPESIF